MKDFKDPGIKLFGKKIALPENGKVPVDEPAEESSGGVVIDRDDGSDCINPCFITEERSCSEGKKVNSEEEEEVEEGDKEEEAEKDRLVRKHSETEQEGESPPEMTQPSTNSKAMCDSDDNPKTPSIDEDSATAKPQKTENDQSGAANSQQKTLKKPDKILPCPRCNSMDTKFCYYNNYNVNQPRHFCKSCQRYWTAGGTMRNMPVGAGRRKNKNSASHNRYVTISEAFHAARIDAPNGIGIVNPAFKANGKVLSFGSDSQLLESMACTLNLAEKKAPDGTRIVTCKVGENGNDCSSGSSVTTSNSVAERGGNPKMQNIHGFPSQVPCIPGVAWPYPWNSTVPVPAICPPPGYPMPMYPSPYWNCSVPGAWSIPWFSPSPPVLNRSIQGSESSSPTLGKHSREGELLKPSNPEEEPVKQKNSVLIPKTLRIDDPDEAAKSSIWATLGIKNDSINRGGLFKAFQAKGEAKNHTATTSPLLQANPAALSRSLCFQERA